MMTEVYLKKFTPISDFYYDILTRAQNLAPDQPLILTRSEFGQLMVESLLFRIEHGLPDTSIPDDIPCNHYLLEHKIEVIGE